MEQNNIISKLQIKEKKVKHPELFKIVLSEQLETKIRTYCALSPEREWSGVLFYKFEGTFKDGITILANDMYLMDQGTAAHTEFDLNEPEITRYMVFEGLIDHCIGLVHSHNRMASFYSGEDTSTLIQYGNEMNNFVSLVVNNAGQYVARVTRKCQLNGTKVTTINGTLTSTLFNTEQQESSPVRGNTTESIESTYLEYVNLNVERPPISTADTLVRFGEINHKCSTSKVSLQSFTFNNTKQKEVQGSLWNDYYGPVGSVASNIEKNEIGTIDWNKHGYKEWFTKLLNGSPFDTTVHGVKELSVRYLKAFETVEKLSDWFEMWFDYMASIYDTSWIDDDWGDGEEALACKVMTDLEDYIDPQANFAEVMIDVINKRL